MALSLRVDIVSDVLCPWCYIGLRRFQQALKMLQPQFEQVEVSWHPYRLLPATIQPMHKKEMYMAKFGPDKFEKMKAMMLKEGQSCGIAFNYSDDAMVGPTTDAHRLIAWVPKEKQNQLVELLFAAYHEKGLLISDPKTLVDCATACGLDGSAVFQFLQSSEGRAELEHDIESARQEFNVLGGVPHFVFTIKGRVSEAKAVVSGGQAPDYFRLMIERAIEKAQMPSM